MEEKKVENFDDAVLIEVTKKFWDFYPPKIEQFSLDDKKIITITFEQVNNFSRFLAKALMNSPIKVIELMKNALTSMALTRDAEIQVLNLPSKILVDKINEDSVKKKSIDNFMIENQFKKSRFKIKKRIDNALNQINSEKRMILGLKDKFYTNSSNDALIAKKIALLDSFETTLVDSWKKEMGSN